MFDICQQCNMEARPSHLRPYGPGGSMICHECAQRPELREEVEKNLRSRVSAVMVAAVESGGAMRLDPDGPRVVGVLDSRLGDTVIKIPVTAIANIRAQFELDADADYASRTLSRALRCYERAASRPRKIACWEFVSQQLWNARQDALHSGVLDRDSERYREISHRYSDALRRCEFGHLLEDLGHSDVRV